MRSQRRGPRTKRGNTVIEGDRTIVRALAGRSSSKPTRTSACRFAPNAKVEVRATAVRVYERPGNVQIINITDNNGRLLRRVRRGSDGREVVLIENRRGPGFGTGLAVGLAVGVGAVVALNLAAPVINIPRERYIVDLDVAPPDLLYETLASPPLMAIERPYTLDEIRYNVELRDRMRRVDINTINFDTGSWTVTPDQYDRLAGIAEAIRRLLQRRPDEVVMIEGHTDAVGNDEDNLSLSDRRAETVASILIEQFGIPRKSGDPGLWRAVSEDPDAGPNRLNPPRRSTADQGIAGGQLPQLQTISRRLSVTPRSSGTRLAAFAFLSHKT